MNIDLKTLRQMHDQYHTHSRRFICECGKIIREEFSLSEIKDLPLSSLKAIALEGSKQLQSLVFGILAYSSPSKLEKLESVLETKNPIIAQAKKDAPINKDIAEYVTKSRNAFKITKPNFRITKEKGWERITIFFGGYIKWYYYGYGYYSRNNWVYKIINKYSSNVFYYYLKKKGVKTGWLVAYKNMTDDVIRWVTIPRQIRNIIDLIKYGKNPSETINKLRDKANIRGAYGWDYKRYY